MNDKIAHFTQHAFEIESFKAILVEIFPQIHFIEPNKRALPHSILKSQTAICENFKLSNKNFGIYIFECESVRAKVGIHTELKSILKHAGLDAIIAIFHTPDSPSLAKNTPPQTPRLRGGAYNDSPSLAGDSAFDSPSLAHGDSKNPPSLAEGVRGWVDSPDSSLRDFAEQNRGNPNSPESSLRTSEASVAIQNKSIDCHEDSTNPLAMTKKANSKIFDENDNRATQRGSILDETQRVASETKQKSGLRSHERENKTKASIDEASGKLHDLSLKDSASNEFRLSLITSGYDYEANKPTYSNLKRQSYILGHAKTATAQKALAELIKKAQKSQSLTQSDLELAFSQEPVSKEFYNKIITQYLEILEHSHFPTHASEYDKRSFVLRLLCRILFCKFLEKKGIINCAIWDTNLSKDYYHEVLEPLFFTTLNTPRESRNYDFLPEQIINLLSAIPYLNGGLFSPQDNDFFSTQNPHAHLHDLHIPNQSFSNLFALLDRYNFTLDEQSPSEQEVALDPELLGTVFESLLSQLFTDNKVEKLDKNTLRKATGSYYTPREIVRYMVRSAILAHLQTHLKGKVDSAFLENLVFESSPSLARNTPPQPLPQGEGLSLISPSLAEGVRGWVDSPDSSSRGEAQAINADSSLRDFAKQSRGNPDSQFTCHTELSQESEVSQTPQNRDISAFSKPQYDKSRDISPNAQYDKNTSTLILQELSTLKILDPACGSGAFPMGILSEIIRIQSDLGDTRPPYTRKLAILQECIYGIDIQPMATEIARLRCFLSLIIDEDFSDNKEPNPLPNLEFKFISANSLLPLPKDNALQYDGYQNDMRELKSLREAYFNAHAKSSLRGDSTLSPSLAEGDTGGGLKAQNNSPAKFSNTESTHPLSPLSAREGGQKANPNAKSRNDAHSSKSAIQKAYMTLRTKIATTIQAVQRQDFADNPILDYDPFSNTKPAQFFDSAYMFGIESFDIVIGNPPYGAKIDESQKQKFKNAYKHATQGSLDTYKLFIEKGFDLLAQNGNLSYIVPLSVTSSKSNIALHKMLLENCEWIEVSNYGNAPARIFPNADQRVSIINFAKTLTKAKNLFTTKVNLRHSTTSIAEIIDKLRFVDSLDFIKNGAFCKISLPIEKSIMQKLYAKKPTLKDIMNGDEQIYYRSTGGRYYDLYTSYSTESSKEKSFAVSDSKALVALMSSNLFWWFRNAYSNGRDSYVYEFERFPIPKFSDKVLKQLCDLGEKYESDIEKNADFSNGVKTYKLRKSKHIIDEIDRLICPLYDLSDEETDFIINYDIAFRTD
ncbi:Eco57I restriction-modification methylase domain-containing protein [Helicobacter sp. T3_23-1059]